jgi:hypothetical protein
VSEKVYSSEASSEVEVAVLGIPVSVFLSRLAVRIGSLAEIYFLLQLFGHLLALRRSADQVTLTLVSKVESILHHGFGRLLSWGNACLANLELPRSGGLHTFRNIILELNWVICPLLGPVRILREKACSLDVLDLRLA